MNFSRWVTLALLWEAPNDYDRSKLKEADINLIIGELAKKNAYVRRFNEQEWHVPSQSYNFKK